MQTRTTTFLALLAALAFAGPAHAGLIDFSGFGHGQVIDGQYFASDGLTISADNHSKPFDLAVIFDSGLTATADDDLEGPGGRLWAGGNVAEDQAFGNLLIVQENQTGCGDGVCDSPDDQLPSGGDLIFAFDRAIERFGFDVVDIESAQAAGARVLFFSDVGPALATVSFADFECAAGPYCDGSVDFMGDNGANHLTDVTAASLGIDGFDRVVIDLNGSGGVDNVRWADPGGPQVPEPALLTLLAPGLAFLARSRHRS